MARPLHLLVVVAIAITLAATSRPARAQFGGWRGGASLALDTSYQRVDDAGLGEERVQMGTMGVNLRAMAMQGFWLLYAAGLDFHFGASDPRGFVYEADLYPLGTGFLIGANAKVGVRAGIGLSGNTDYLPLSTQFPIELAVEFDLHRRVRVAGFARATWVTDNQREHGTVNFDFTDEASAGISLRWGKRYYPHDNTLSAGNGYFLGAMYQEQNGSTIIGAVFGYSLNVSIGRFASARRHYPRGRGRDLEAVPL